MTSTCAIEDMRIDRYLGAAEALYESGVNPLPVLEATRSLSQEHDEVMLLHALSQVNKLHGIKDVSEVGTAYWHWVKKLTQKDIAQRKGTDSDWHTSRVGSAQRNLEIYARQSSVGDSVLSAARHFYGVRPGHQALIIG